jgi:hypothetical protein
LYRLQKGTLLHQHIPAYHLCMLQKVWGLAHSLEGWLKLSKLYSQTCTGCQVNLYSCILKNFLYSYNCLKFPILHPKILYLSKTMRKKVESFVLRVNFI